MRAIGDYRKLREGDYLLGVGLGGRQWICFVEKCCSKKITLSGFFYSPDGRKPMLPLSNRNLDLAVCVGYFSYKFYKLNKKEKDNWNLRVTESRI